MRLIALLAALAVLGLSGAPLPAQSADSAADALVLSPGDAIRITVWRKQELSGEFKVASDGSIADPFYMDLRVADVPFPTVTQQVRAHIGRYENNPLVLVEPLFRISVGGEVRQPNLYTLRPETTIEQAVMEAGGPTDTGRLDRVRLLRGDQEFVIDLSDSREARARMPTRSGDQIWIGQRKSIIREYLGPVSSIISAFVSVTYVVTRYF